MASAVESAYLLSAISSLVPRVRYARNMGKISFPPNYVLFFTHSALMKEELTLERGTSGGFSLGQEVRKHRWDRTLRSFSLGNSKNQIDAGGGLPENERFPHR